MKTERIKQKTDFSDSGNKNDIKKRKIFIKNQRRIKEQNKQLN